MLEDVIIAGFGGQGIIFAGKLLAYAGLKEEKEVVYYPSYGAEMRGGTANCTVIISDSMVPSPIISSPSNAIIMSNPAFLKFSSRVKKGGRIVINTSLISTDINRQDVEVVKISANQIAEELGSGKTANMVALGAWISLSRVVTLENLISSLKDVISEKRMALLPINEKSLRKGWEFVSSLDR